MENLIVSLNVVFPLFAMMAVGFFLNRIGILDSHTADVMNKVTFKAFLPTLIFYNIYQTDVSEIFNGKLILWGIALVLIMFFLLWGVVPRFEHDHRRKGVLIQGMFRSNFILYGLPVTASLFGDENVGTASMLIAFIVPFYNVLSVIVLEWYASGQIHVKKIIKGILTNPLIIGAALGGLMLLFNIPLIPAVEKTIRNLSGMATPMAFLILGASFRFSALAGNIRPLLVSVLVKLIVFPAIFLPVSILAGYRGMELAALLTMLGAPTAVSSFTMAKQMNGDGELAGQIVIFTSICSVLTMFVWIFVLKQFAYI